MCTLQVCIKLIMLIKLIGVERERKKRRGGGSTKGKGDNC